MAKELPGFYYDEEKRKYFRIQQPHKIVGGVGHTKSSVKAVKQAKADHQQSQQHVERQSAGTVRRSSLLHKTTSHISARLGASFSHTKADIVREYGAALRRHPVRRLSYFHPDEEITCGYVASNFSITPSGSLCTIYKEPTSGISVSRTSMLDVWSTHRTRQQHHVIDSFRLNSRCLGWCDSPADLLTTMHNGHDQGYIVVKSSPASNQISIRPSLPTLEPDNHADFFYSSNTANLEIQSTWDITSAPHRPIAALATNAGLVLVDCHFVQANSNDAQIPILSCAPRLEQMNVCFKDDNIVMSGERSGRINFTDTRLDQTRSNFDDRKASSVIRLLHSSAVLATQPLHNDNQVVAHGFSSTNIYDLRFVSQTPIKPNRGSRHYSSLSRPYLKCSVPRGRYTNNYTPGRKLAYSSDLDLVAAASSESHPHPIKAKNHVTLYSATTGRPISSPISDHLFGNPLKHIEMRRVRDGPESIFVLSGNKLEEWYYGDGHDGDKDEDGYEDDSTTTNTQTIKMTELSAEQEWNRGNHRN